jgi:flagellar M-ring protein FliF
MDRLQNLLVQLREFLAGLPPARRASFIGMTVAILAGTFGLLIWVQRPQYTTLFTKLDANDAGGVIEYLKGAKIPYRIGDDGSSIEVSKANLYEARMALAARGLPQGGSIGFEIFDKQTLGMTDFVQRLDFQRALQGELARTIMGLSAVEAARVHLALPERSLFVSEDRRPSASVVLKMRPGRSLTPEQVSGVANLVASSVERLTPSDVTIVDVSGQVLSSDRTQARERGTADAMRSYQTGIEQEYVERIESLLDRALGPGHAVARVTATLDLAQIERTEETFDPDKTAVRSEKRNTEKNATASASGTPGVAATLSNEQNGGGSQEGPSSQREDANVTYEVSKVTSRRVEAMGTIRKLSVAVLMDGAAKAGGDAKQFTPRPAEELERYKELVKKAVGFSDERGDQIEVVSAPFEGTLQAEPEAPSLMARMSDWSDVIWRVVGIVLFLVISLMVVRPFLLAMVNRVPAVPSRALVAAVEQAALPEPTSFTRDVGEIARSNPQQTAMVIRQWVEMERQS